MRRNSTTKKLVPALLCWFAENARDLPWRRTNDPYAIWVSEIMLQQTQVKTVLPYWTRWMKTLPTVRSLARARPEKVLKLWEGLGYYTRARNLQKAAQQICSKYDGKFPRDFDDILALPGIGRYTAGAIASIAFNEPRPILDGNVIRVLTRIFGIAKNPREKETNNQLWQIAGSLVTIAAESESKHPSPVTRHSSLLNQSLMELGALICSPRNPGCPACPAKKFCAAFREDRVTDLPNLGKRATPTNRRFIAFAISKSGKYFVRQRPAGVVNARLWEFPNVEANETDLHEAARAAFGFDPLLLQPLCSIKHSITRYRICLDVFRADLSGSQGQFPFRGRWCSLSELERLSFPSAHRKIMGKIKSSPQSQSPA